MNSHVSVANELLNKVWYLACYKSVYYFFYFMYYKLFIFVMLSGVVRLQDANYRHVADNKETLAISDITDELYICQEFYRLRLAIE